MGIIILVGLVIGYIVLAVLASKTWQAMHVVLLVGLFIMTVVFSIFSASVLKTQMKFRNQYNQVKADLDRELEKAERLLNGDPLGEGDAALSFLTLEGNVRRALVDRGRVWRNLRVADNPDNSFVLDASTWGDDAAQKIGLEEDYDEIEPIADGENALGITPLAIDVGSVLFAFGETPITSLSPELQKILFGENDLPQRDTNGICKLPTAYLGEYRVTQVAEDNSSITIEPSIELDEKQKEIVLTPNMTWALYEKLPLDAHDAFAGLTEEQFRVLMPQDDMQLEQSRYDNLIAEFSRDQQDAVAADPPERTWIRVKFLKAHEFDPVDVQDAVPEPTSPFDATGRAQSALLQHGEKVRASQDDEVVFDNATANRLISQGVAERVAENPNRFVRRLRDYDMAFRNYLLYITATNDKIATAQSDLTALQNSSTKLQAQIAYRTDENAKLRHDLEGVQRDQQAITNHHNALQAQWEQVKSDLSRLYRANRKLVKQGENLVPVSTNR